MQHSIDGRKANLAADKLDEKLIRQALAAARDTRSLAVDGGIRHDAQRFFSKEFATARAIIVADGNTFPAAGEDVLRSFTRKGHSVEEPFVFGPHVYANWQCVEELTDVLRKVDAIPVAVGSGTINDLTKLASSRVGRPYMVVATAASMDGYTAYGASITRDGSKQTFDCPAPLAALADLEVIAAAPARMSASGYADLTAKCAAGGDWILADAAGEEPIDVSAWRSVQGPLLDWLASPEGVAAGDPGCLRRLIYGLMMSGFVMQAMRSSRPASGAEHQFSHLWDMQHHVYNGEAPSHGFKVGVGTLASLAVYDYLLESDLAPFDVEQAVSKWPSIETLEARIAAVLGDKALAGKAVGEMRVKYISHESLRAQLMRLRDHWPGLRERLKRRLPRFAETRERLRTAGCPFEPEQIGISRERLRLSFEQAWYIRRRYTVLDFVQRAGIAGSTMDAIFGGAGRWPIPAGGARA